MAHGRTLFARLVELLPRRAFDSAVARYRGDHRVRSLSCMDQMLAMIYAQVTGRSSLRETALCLGALGAQRYHCGIRGAVAKSSLADANESPFPMASSTRSILSTRSQSNPDRIS